MKRLHERSRWQRSVPLIRTSITAAILVWLSLVDPARAQGVIDAERARAYFDEIRAVSDEDAGRLWGVELFGPTLFVDRGTRELVASHPDVEGLLTVSGSVYTGTLPSGVPIANASVEWAGVRWTMLQWPLPRGRYTRVNLLTHESFHRIQPVLGLPMTSPENRHLDTPEGRILLRLEWRALQDALSHSGNQRMVHLRVAMDFRAARLAISEEAAEEERSLLLNEGLAEYTGVAASIPEGLRAGWAARNLEDYDARALGGPLTRNFAYASGPAYGLLLDDLVPGWRTEVTRAFDLGGRLARQIRGSGPAGRADSASETWKQTAAPYGGDLLVQEETQREEERREKEAAYRRRFMEGPTLTIESPSSFNYNFDPSAIFPLGGEGAVNRSWSASGDWGMLEAAEDTGVEILLLRNEEGGIIRAVLEGPLTREEAALSGPGWTLRPSEGWTVYQEAEGRYTLQKVPPESIPE